jgi:hypothetical protein
VELGLAITSNQSRSELVASSGGFWSAVPIGCVSEYTQQRYGWSGQFGALVPIAADGDLGLDANVSVASELFGEDNFNVFDDGASMILGAQVGICLALGRP